MNILYKFNPFHWIFAKRDEDLIPNDPAKLEKYKQMFDSDDQSKRSSNSPKFADDSDYTGYDFSREMPAIVPWDGNNNYLALWKLMNPRGDNSFFLS